MALKYIESTLFIKYRESTDSFRSTMTNIYNIGYMVTQPNYNSYKDLFSSFQMTPVPHHCDLLCPIKRLWNSDISADFGALFPASGRMMS